MGKLLPWFIESRNTDCGAAPGCQRADALLARNDLHNAGRVLAGSVGPDVRRS